MSFENGRENRAAYLPGMDETVLADMDDYEQHRLDLLRCISEAGGRDVDRLLHGAELREHAISTARYFGEAFLALYDFRGGDVPQVRALTARLWQADDIARYQAMNDIVGWRERLFWPARQGTHDLMIRERMDLRCPEPLLWASLISRRYRDRIVSDNRTFMHYLPKL